MIVRLGAPGVVHAVVVDTAYFTGNYPAGLLGGGVLVAGYPGPAALAAARWAEIVPRSPLQGDVSHVFEVPPRHRFSHVRLRIYPDGGVARLRVHGQVVPDPSLLDGLTFDLAALENGGDVQACSDRFYSAPRNAISPGLSRVMGEGWETRRRRSAGNEWLVVGLHGAGGGVAGRDRHVRIYRERSWHGGVARAGRRGAGRGLIVGAAAAPDAPAA